MRGHTPGPWHVSERGFGSYPRATVYATDSALRYVAICDDRCNEAGDETDNFANARLIAAAPDLLALTQRYAAECGECSGTGLVTITTYPGGIEVSNDDQPCSECADIRALIAKATGETP